ncbi:MAG: hypothetical protein COB88_10410 [Flavobacteriales bacterium]|nr:MAG: hypothetical protein COB88_10410 [Flavobacteriales bacterium]
MKPKVHACPELRRTEPVEVSKGTPVKDEPLVSNARYLIAISLLLLSYSSRAQYQFADKSFYLIDSLVVNNLTQSDRSLIDSTLKLYHEAAHDTTKLNCLQHIVEECWDEAVWPKYNQFMYKMVQDILSSGLSNTLPAGQAGLEKKYLFFLAEALNNIGYIYKHQGDILKALEYYQRSLNIHEEIDYKEGIAMALNNFGSIYNDQDDIPKALEYYHKSLKIREEIGDKEGIAMSLNNIGYIYYHQRDASTEALPTLPTGRQAGQAGSAMVERLNKALYYHLKSLKLEEEMGNKHGIAASLNNIGYIYKDQGDISEALECFHKSLKIEVEIGWRAGTARSLGNIALLLEEQGWAGLSEAKGYATRSLTIGREIGSPDLIEQGARVLSRIAKKQGDYREALEMYELQVMMTDSINNEKTQKATIRQQTKYEFEKAQLVKEQEGKETARLEVEVNQRRDNLQYSVILIAILVLFGAVLALGFINVSERMAEGIIFFSFLILFEFFLVLADPYIEGWSGGAPGIKLLFNAGIAALIFPAHAFFESKMKGRLVKSN